MMLQRAELAPIDMVRAWDESGDQESALSRTRTLTPTRTLPTGASMG